MRTNVGIALSVLVAFSGCNGLVIALGPAIVGSGVTKDESRDVPGFRSVDVSGTIQATVAIGEKPSVTLSMDDNLLEQVVTEVKEGRLSVRLKPGTRVGPKAPMKVAIVAPSIEALVASGASKVVATVGEAKSFRVESSGAADVEVTGLAAESVQVSASGAGQVHLGGKGKMLQLDASGASHVEASKVEFESASADVSGASSASVHATGSISGNVSGASSLSVKGNPARRSVGTSGASSVSY